MLKSTRAWAACALALAQGCSRTTSDAGVTSTSGYGDGYRGTADAGTRRLDPRSVPADAPKVVFVGDSLAAGLHLEADAAFPAVLQRRCVAAGLPFHLVNAGVSGDTSAGGRARMAWLLAQDPDLLVIELGANDALRGVEVAATEANLRAILAAVRDAGARALLLGVRVPPSLGVDYSEALAALYPRLAAEFDVPLVPYFLAGVGGVPELNLPDGIHPTAVGHERVADTIEPALRAALTALRESK